MEKDNTPVSYSKEILDLLFQNKLFQHSPEVFFKGHKLLLALNLATEHVTEDAIVIAIRKSAVDLFTSLFSGNSAQTAIEASYVLVLIESSSFLGSISITNAAILVKEVQVFIEMVISKRTKTAALLDSHFFKSPQYVEQTHEKDIKDIKRQYYTQQYPKGISEYPVKDKNQIPTDKNAQRTDKVVSFLKEKGPVSIREIRLVIKDISEKTIQRELATLVDQGRVIRTGERRWSTYMLA